LKLIHLVRIAFQLKADDYYAIKTKIDEKEIWSLVEDSPVGRLVLSCRDGPYVVPINYVFFANAIWFHTRAVGKKIDCIEHSGSVLLEIDTFNAVDLSGLSVVIRSSIERIIDPEGISAVFNRLREKFPPSCKDRELTSEAVTKMLERKEFTIFKIPFSVGDVTARKLEKAATSAVFP